jgi:hypothetical protein
LTFYSADAGLLHPRACDNPSGSHLLEAAWVSGRATERRRYAEADARGDGRGGSVRSPEGEPRKGSGSTGCIRRTFSVTVKTRMG